jgi:diacylglycerol kinase
MIGFLKGFIYAFNGLVVFFRHERNGRIQLIVAIIAVVLSWILKISVAEWMVILGCIASVLSFEMINSSIEKLCNLVHPKFHPAVKTIKDISAGAVLLVAISSAIIGAIIFIPKIYPLL